MNVHSNCTVRMILYNSDSNLLTVNVPPNTDELITISPLEVNNGTLFVNMFIQVACSNFVYYLDNISLEYM